MELHKYIGIVRRSVWLVVAIVVLFVAVAAQLQRSQTPVYQATAEVLLKPNNPEERYTEPSQVFFDPDRHALQQLTIIGSRAVAARAAAALPGMTEQQVRDAVSVAAADKDDIMSVTAEHVRPVRAKEIADAVAAAYIEDRRLTNVANLNSKLTAIDKRLAELKVDLDARRPATPAPGLNVPAADPTYTAASARYDVLSEEREGLGLDIQYQKGEAEVIRTAEVPTKPIGTSLPAALILGALVGAMAGFGAALLRDQLDDSVRSTEEAERLSGLRVLAKLPADRTSAKRPSHLATVADPLGPLAEASRSLRTSISLLALDTPINRVMITSASPGDGKTLVTANLGVTYAQAGSSTLLVSADLRRPRLESLMGVVQPRPGLRDILADQPLSSLQPMAAGNNDATRAEDEAQSRRDLRAALERFVLPTAVPGLFLLPAGPTPSNPSELLASDRMSQVLDVLNESFDMVILDTSPLLAVSDAAALAPKVGHLVVVASMTSTHRRALAQVAKAVRSAHANVLGIVLNKADVSATPYGGYRPEPRASSIEVDAVPTPHPQPHPQQPAAEKALEPQTVTSGGRPLEAVASAEQDPRSASR
ncbi:MAG: Tyrosine-protein kinase EpsD [uncultured Acidimicrobiales bacterium]|uniref:Tyrosine-protein kinase EpsD n=1 Tax=uncultured Acidimicrobiales bacterium TaxID=310071 RepID=A0A6J4HFD4_9ACTN|nr:MAG: Tyrosine-protein kinase EpsD [uncultured Acidimicrobiales bacterium]